MTDATELDTFRVEQVQLRFDISADFVATQVANNVLILALSTGRLLRFDLDNDADIDDIDLPRKATDTGVIRKLFLDPSASHLIISTSLGENYYLHTQSRQPRLLSRLKGLLIESIAWNPLQPTSSTREILLATKDGSIYETYIGGNATRHLEKYVSNVFSIRDGIIGGIFVDAIGDRLELRRVLIVTQNKIWHFLGKDGSKGNDSSTPSYARLFEDEVPTSYTIDSEGGRDWRSPSQLAVSPDMLSTVSNTTQRAELERAFAWQCSQGIYHEILPGTIQPEAGVGQTGFQNLKFLPWSSIYGPGVSNTFQTLEDASSLLTNFHILSFAKGHLTCINRLNGTTVFRQQILNADQTALGIYADHQKKTYWLLTPRALYEIVVTNEERDLWKILLHQGRYETAAQFAQGGEQKDAVAAAQGEHLLSQGRFHEAAFILGACSTPFEDVAIKFINHSQRDALRQYLLTKLSGFDAVQKMQRTILATWLIELFMVKLNQLDDLLATEPHRASATAGPEMGKDSTALSVTRDEFRRMVSTFKKDLDRATTYSMIGAHGRQEELLYFATVVEDHDFVISYWINREEWATAMSLLKKQTDPEMFHKYSSVLIAHCSVDLVDVLMRQTNLDPKKIIPALLNYNHTTGSTLPLTSNQAVRYLRFCTDILNSADPLIHNTLLSILATHSTSDESFLLDHLRRLDEMADSTYDKDFALRLCISHNRIQSAVHVYAAIRQFSSAAELALQHNEIELAADIADTAHVDDTLRKKLWLKVAKKVINQSPSIKSAIQFLKRCDLVKIEDLIPLFPDFIVIDAFKEEICAALENYSRQIDELMVEMDKGEKIAQHVKNEIRSLDNRYALVMPGERCWKCRLPLLVRQFFVFPCQHSFHADCLGEIVMSMAGMGKETRIRQLQREIGRGVALGKGRDIMVKELDGLVAGSCVLCGELAVKHIEDPFTTSAEDQNDWSI